MADHEDDEFAPSQTAGYKPGEKKSLQEYQTLDANDESLQKWKASLGLGQVAAASTPSNHCVSVDSHNPGPADDPRRVVVEKIALEVVEREDVVLDLSTPELLKGLKDNPFTIKEGVEYRIKVKFRIQHEVVAGLKYLQVVKRHGIRGAFGLGLEDLSTYTLLCTAYFLHGSAVDKSEEMIGSYGPSTEPYEKKFMVEEAPAGMLARGHYEAKSKFVDDDNVTHMEWNWSFDIKKDW
ncbi:immunoglobulin E-set [Endogone sp. FLAS-F59071]|nr:immunoglobulin E-set [Endogone sp. FLAS-F59071]|eukprot:RUS15220.1 immunoglobulin E-set [Endogone sp. FLAS-F59071]